MQEIEKSSKINIKESGVLIHDSEEAEEKSIKAYENIRKYNGDIERIAKYTNYDINTIKEIKIMYFMKNII